MSLQESWPPVEFDYSVRSSEEQICLNRARLIRKLFKDNFRARSSENLLPSKLLTIHDQVDVSDDNLMDCAPSTRQSVKQTHRLSHEYLVGNIQFLARRSASHQGVADLIANVIKQHIFFSSLADSSAPNLINVQSHTYQTAKAILGACNLLSSKMSKTDSGKFGLHIMELSCNQIFYNSVWRVDLFQLGLRYAVPEPDLHRLNWNAPPSAVQQPPGKSADTTTGSYRPSQVLVKAVDPPSEATDMTKTAVEKLLLWFKHCHETSIAPDFERKLKLPFRIAI